MLWLLVTQLSKAYRIVGSTMALHTFEFFTLYFYQCIGWILRTMRTTAASFPGPLFFPPPGAEKKRDPENENRELGKSHLTSPLAPNNLLVIPYLSSRANYFIDW